MKIHGKLSINGRKYNPGDQVPGLFVYPFFLVHMLMFGGSGFLIAYSDAETPVLFLYLHGGFAILIYTVFYFAMFGVDEVKWMFINGALSALAIYSQIGWLLSLFGREVGDFPYYVHVIPFLYFVLYTFLVRQAVLDFTNSRDNETRKRVVEFAYIAISVAFYLLI
ncbi:MAG: hypothetical protein HKN85_03860 [Gammaproteobacteria bacterium]|nr:hypothetical protein [Gammaproteobacteria bacterium]